MDLPAGMHGHSRPSGRASSTAAWRSATAHVPVCTLALTSKAPELRARQIAMRKAETVHLVPPAAVKDSQSSQIHDQRYNDLFKQCAFLTFMAWPDVR
jgi:hypothetical protein